MPFLFGVCLAWLLLHAAAAVLKYFCGCKFLGIGLISVSVQTSRFNRCTCVLLLARVSATSVHTMPILHTSTHTQTCVSVCRLFYKFGRKHNAALREWYSIGVAVGAMLGLSVVFMLLQYLRLVVAWIKEVQHS